jgi:carboxyl-terminal processing protease
MAHLNQISARSVARVAANEVFTKIKSNAARLQKLRELTAYPLNVDDFRALEATRKADAERFNNLFDEVVNPGARNLAVDLPAIAGDESKKARNEDFLKAVSKDVYIHEVLAIMHDVIELERVATRD